MKKYLWARKKNEITHRKVVKFVEASWRFLFYTTFVVLGYNALFVPNTAIWVTESMQMFQGWPMHRVSDVIHFYYMVELGAYIHQLLWTEVNRSDSVEMILHHFITIALIVGSYLSNFTRIGTSILLIHDTADIFLEFGKCLNYTAKAKGNKWLQPIVDGVFGMFMIAFFVTRLVIFPRYIIYTMLTEGYQCFGCEWGGCYFYVGLLCSLQCLHIFWFYLIARMAYRLLIKGEVEKDVRSDDEDDVGDEFPATSTSSDNEDSDASDAKKIKSDKNESAGKKIAAASTVDKRKNKKDN